MELHVSPILLGSILVNARGSRRRVVATWLEDSANPAHRPAFIALTVDLQTGEFYKVTLPDPDWSMVVGP